MVRLKGRRLLRRSTTWISVVKTVLTLRRAPA